VSNSVQIIVFDSYLLMSLHSNLDLLALQYVWIPSSWLTYINNSLTTKNNH